MKRSDSRDGQRSGAARAHIPRKRSQVVVTQAQGPLRGKTALVTGAGGGIGAAAAVRLAREGARLILAGPHLVSILSPGATNSPLWDRFPNDFNRQTMLTVQDVADVIAYVASQPPNVLVEGVSLVYPLGNQ